MRKSLLLLLLLCIEPRALSQVTFSGQWNNFIFDDSIRINRTQGSWSLGLLMEKSLSTAIPMAPPFLSLAGQGEFGNWSGQGIDSIDVRSSVFSSVFILAKISDALKIGPGIGIIGLFGDDWKLPAHTRFPTVFILFSKIEFPGTPFGIGYRYQSSSLGDRPSLKYFSNNICIFFDISMAYNKSEKKP